MIIMHGMLGHFVIMMYVLSLSDGEKSRNHGRNNRKNAVNDTVLPYMEQSRDSLTDLVSDFWSWRLRKSPEFATVMGHHEYDDQLETLTMRAFTHNKNDAEAFLSRLLVLEQRPMTSHTRDNLVILRHDLETYIHGYKWHRFATLNPLNFLEGIHKDYSYWLDAMPFDTEADYDRYITRLRALATQINEQISLMREAVRIGWTNHRLSMEPVLSTLQELDVKAVDTPFYRPFNDSLEMTGFSNNKIENYRWHADAVILDHVLPSFNRLHRFLEEEYMPHTRRTAGVGSLPGGASYYRDCIRWHLSLDLEPKVLHNLGRETVANIRKDMNEIRESVGFQKDLSQFLMHIHTAPKYFYQTEENLMKEYEHLVIRRLPQKLRKIFRKVPVFPITIQEMPFDGPMGVTMPPSEDGEMPGVFFVNVQQPHTRPKWQMMALALHETNPGHHFRTCYAFNQTVPQYRRNLDYRKLYSIPFLFPSHAAFIEGWALYAESLGTEMGLYTNPMDKFGHLSSDLLKSTRIVVDTGIHSMGWSRDESITYMSEQTGLSHDESSTQVDRIITIPGQALTDKIGYIKIIQLRKKAEAMLGHRFDVKDFHHQILKSGPVPLSILDYIINSWLRSKVPQYYSSSTASSCSSNQNYCIVFCLSIVFYMLYRVEV